jgi:hypothetical protein
MSYVQAFLHSNVLSTERTRFHLTSREWLSRGATLRSTIAQFLFLVLEEGRGGWRAWRTAGGSLGEHRHG